MCRIKKKSIKALHREMIYALTSEPLRFHGFEIFMHFEDLDFFLDLSFADKATRRYRFTFVV